jgi:hypothetical protein
MTAPDEEDLSWSKEKQLKSPQDELEQKTRKELS